MNTKRRAVFLDRDGVINETIDRGEHFEVLGKKVRFSPPFFYHEFHLRDGVKEALERMGELGYLRILVTNQPDRAYGMITEEEYQKIMAVVAALPFDDIFVCPHTRYDNCACKKPKPGMLLEAGKKWGIDFSRSYIIGDTKADTEAGEAVGSKTVLIDYSYNKDLVSDIRVNGLLDAIPYLSL
ncbi:MAG: HAD-IIIA family hydrolase [Candidatus Magasanikbacteria bacterium]|nr:HAD-IIIA family hydrolase [Candidatus Magasanikbacteria bacterium]